MNWIKRVSKMSTTYRIIWDHLEFTITMGHEAPICACYYVRLDIRDLALEDTSVSAEFPVRHPVWIVPASDIDHAVAMINTWTAEEILHPNAVHPALAHDEDDRAMRWDDSSTWGDVGTVHP